MSISAIEPTMTETKAKGTLDMNTPPSADRIEYLSFGFMASKVLFSAIEFGLFSELAKAAAETCEAARYFLGSTAMDLTSGTYSRR